MFLDRPCQGDFSMRIRRDSAQAPETLGVPQKCFHLHLKPEEKVTITIMNM